MNQKSVRLGINSGLFGKRLLWCCICPLKQLQCPHTGHVEILDHLNPHPPRPLLSCHLSEMLIIGCRSSGLQPEDDGIGWQRAWKTKAWESADGRRKCRRRRCEEEEEPSGVCKSTMSRLCCRQQVFVWQRIKRACLWNRERAWKRRLPRQPKGCRSGSKDTQVRLQLLNVCVHMWAYLSVCWWIEQCMLGGGGGGGVEGELRESY